MTWIDGPTAIIEGGRIIAIRGPGDHRTEPRQPGGQYALPYEEIVDDSSTDPDIAVRESVVDDIQADKAVRTITIRDKTAQELADEDQARLNASLIEDGSVVRALGILTFKEINKLRQNAGLNEYTWDQFKTAMRDEMRG